MKQKNVSYMLVFSNPLAGKENEYNNWYDNIHVKEVTAVDGILSARRFKLSASQLSDDEQPYRYLAIYELEHGRESETLENLQQAITGMDRQGVEEFIDNYHTVVVESISELVEAL